MILKENSGSSFKSRINAKWVEHRKYQLMQNDWKTEGVINELHYIHGLAFWVEHAIIISLLR